MSNCFQVSLLSRWICKYFAACICVISTLFILTVRQVSLRRVNVTNIGFVSFTSILQFFNYSQKFIKRDYVFSKVISGSSLQERISVLSANIPAMVSLWCLLIMAPVHFPEIRLNQSVGNMIFLHWLWFQMYCHLDMIAN